MDVQKADVVRSMAGRDKGRLFFVLETADGFALLADGKIRKLEKPKRKKTKHIRLEAQGGLETGSRLLAGAPVTNREIRQALAKYAAQKTSVQGGE